MKKTDTIRFCVSLLFVFAACTSVLAERPSMEKTFTTVEELNRSLQTLYEHPSDISVDCLADNVDKLINIHKDIQYLLQERKAYQSQGEINYTVLDRILSVRSAAFLHGWAILTDYYKQNEINDDTLLTNLLTIYGQIAESIGKNDKSPLLTLKANEFLSKKVQSELPTTKALIGLPSDSMSSTGDYTTVWAVVNLKNAQQNQVTGDFEYLRIMSSANYPDEDYPLTSLAGQEINAFQVRLEKFVLYYEFRKWIADEENLETLLNYIRTRIAEAQETVKFERTSDEASSMLCDLIESAEPDAAGEFLPDAAIWLRYILLASYQGLGGEHILDHPNSIERVWENNITLSWAFDTHDVQNENVRIAPVWNLYPAVGSFNRLIADTTRGYLNLAEFQRQEDANTQEYINTYAKMVGVPNFEKQAEKQEIVRLQQDYTDYVQKNDNLLLFHQARQELDSLLKSQPQNRFYNPALQYQQISSAYPELAGCSPIALPTLRYKEYKDQLNAALEDLQKHLKNQRQKEEDKVGIDVARMDASTLRLETLAARLAVDAVELAKQQANLELLIANNNQRAATFRLAAAKFAEEGAKNTRDAQALEQDLAKAKRIFAEGIVKGTKDGIEKAQKQIKLAEESLNDLHRQLLADAKRWEDAIKDAEKRAGIISCAKICVRVIGAVASCFSAGAGSVAAEGICAAISVGCDATIQALDIYQNVTLGGMSEKDAWMQGLVGAFETGAKGYSIYRNYQKNAETEELQKNMDQHNRQKRESYEKSKNLQTRILVNQKHHVSTVEFRSVKLVTIAETEPLQIGTGETSSYKGKKGKFYILPIDKPIVNKLFKYTSDKCDEGTNLKLHHVHFVADDGSYNVGFGPKGIYSLDKNDPLFIEKIPCTDKDNKTEEFDVEMMMQATESLSKSGQWSDETYNVIAHNCQDFHVDVRKVYEEIEQPSQVQNTVAEGIVQRQQETQNDTLHKLSQVSPLPVEDEVESPLIPMPNIDSENDVPQQETKNGVPSEPSQTTQIPDTDNEDWKDVVKKVGKEVFKQGAKLYKEIKEENDRAKKLAKEYGREVVWGDIVNDINRAMSSWRAQEAQNHTKFSGWAVENSELKNALAAVLQSGGEFVFDLDNPIVYEILDDEEVKPDERNDRFIERIEELFVQHDFSQDLSAAQNLGFKIDDYDPSVEHLKLLLQNNSDARTEFWNKVSYGTKFYCQCEENGIIKDIIVENAHSARFAAGWKTGYNDTIQPILDKIESKRSELDSAAKEAENPKALKEVAGKIPDIIGELKTQLSELNDVLAKALEQYETDEKKEQIADLLYYAAVNNFRAAGANLEAARLDVESAETAVTNAELKVRESALKDEGTKALYQAKKIELNKTEYLLRHAYRQYVLSDNSKVEQTKAVFLSGALVKDVFYKDRKSQEILAKICRNYCGLLQWLNLLNSKEPKWAIDWYDELAAMFQQSKDTDLGTFKEQVEKFRCEIGKQITSHANPGAVDFRFWFLPVKELLHVYSEEERTLANFKDDPEFLEWYQSQQGLDLPIARVEFVIPQDVNPSLVDKLGYEGIVLKSDIKLSADELGESNQLLNASYLLKITGQNSTMTGGFPMKIDGEHFTKRNQIQKPTDSLLQNVLGRRIMEGIVDDSIEFYGLYGRWRFYIFLKEPEKPLSQWRDKDVKNLLTKLRVELPVLWIKP